MFGRGGTRRSGSDGSQMGVADALEKEQIA
jgi:hypothetical protein